MQLNQEIEKTKGVTETTFKGCPGTMSRALEVTNAGEHGENRLHNHANVPLTPLANA
jgi:hypothetical protein